MIRTARLYLPALIFAATMCAALLAQAPKRFQFQGTVISVNAANQTATVSHESVEGWMSAMTMSFRIMPPEMVQQLKAGDRISASVVEGNTSTLFEVKVVDAASADAEAPIVWTCPSPGEETVLEETPGRCPMSGAPLIPSRLVTAYSCLKVQLVIRDAPGICPVDRTQLVPITASMFYTCKDSPGVRETSPGRCADGSARVKTFERRAHGDHNPRHGGSLFMSADQYVHVEGALVAPNTFRAYFYDDLTRPMPVTAFTGRVLQTNQNAEPTGVEARLTPVPNMPSALQATVPAGFPVRLKLMMTFKPGEREQPFDFVFNAVSVEP